MRNVIVMAGVFAAAAGNKNINSGILYIIPMKLLLLQIQY
jgi:hypothetical protein